MTTEARTRKPLSAAERKARADRAAERWAAALNRAVSGQSLANYGLIFDGFMAQGIGEDEIEPRVNVFTWGAWKAKGRQPRRDERENFVTVQTWRPVFGDVEQRDGSTRKGKTGMVPTTAKVFHVTQTEPMVAA
jgi:hypothetical protein